MHGMSDILGQLGVLATLLLQRGHGPLDELWEPEFILLIVFLGGLVAVRAVFEGGGLLPSWAPRREYTQGRMTGNGGPRCTA